MAEPIIKICNLEDPNEIEALNKPDTRTISELLADHDLIAAAITRAVREAVLQHARAGHPVSTTRNGKVVWIPPEEILAELAQPKSSP